jgi:hypothetical protein
MVSQVKEAAWMEWITALMEQAAPVDAELRLAPAQFHCLLDDQPNHLLPRRYASRLSVPPKGLTVNPDCVFARNGWIPEGMHPELVSNFATGNVVWVRDSVLESWAPFWLGATLGSWLSRAQPGEAEPRDLPAQARSVLAAAGILVAPNDLEKRRERWAKTLARSKEGAARGYAPVGGLIDPFHIAALRRYYRYLVRTGRVRLGDDQSERRYVAHNESVAQFFHHQLTKAVSDLVGEPVKPSYVYFSSYLSGAELEKHLDRPQCEFSLSLQLDYSPEPVSETSWPLYLDVPGGKVTVYQGLGDALFYRGHQIPHYRSPLREGHVSSHIFFHYVREGFEGPLR